MRKIHKFSVKYKKAVSSDNVDKIIKMTFEDLISEFDYNCIHHYENNKDIIISDTNLNNRYRNDLINFCEELGATVEIKEFEIQEVIFSEAISRYTLPIPD